MVAMASTLMSANHCYLVITNNLFYFKLNSLLGGDGTPLINGLPNDIHNPAQRLWTHWDSDGGTSVQNFLSADQTFSTIHSNGTHCVLP